MSKISENIHEFISSNTLATASKEYLKSQFISQEKNKSNVWKNESYHPLLG